MEVAGSYGMLSEHGMLFCTSEKNTNVLEHLNVHADTYAHASTGRRLSRPHLELLQSSNSPGCTWNATAGCGVLLLFTTEFYVNNYIMWTLDDDQVMQCLKYIYFNHISCNINFENEIHPHLSFLVRIITTVNSKVIIAHKFSPESCFKNKIKRIFQWLTVKLKLICSCWYCFYRNGSQRKEPRRGNGKDGSGWKSGRDFSTISLFQDNLFFLFFFKYYYPETQTVFFGYRGQTVIKKISH